MEGSSTGSKTFQAAGLKDSRRYGAGHSREMRLQIEEMRKALDPCGSARRGSIAGDCQFRLFYQPKIDLRSGRVTGAEALIRWDHPALGIVSPSRFIDLAENSGMMVQLGEWVIRTACIQAQAWRDAGLSPVAVSVNVSRNQFENAHFIATVAGALRDSGLGPEGLGLEVDSAVIFSNPDRLLPLLCDIAAMNVSLAVDAFVPDDAGAQALPRLPPGYLKISRDLVGGLDAGNCQSGVSAAIALGHELNLRVVAVGVATERHLEFLRRQGCDEMQGYLRGRPVPPERLAGLLAGPDS